MYQLFKDWRRGRKELFLERWLSVDTGALCLTCGVYEVVARSECNAVGDWLCDECLLD